MPHDLIAKASGLIFDCDGTLADTMPLHWRSWQAIAGSYGFHFPEERFYQLGGVPSVRILEMLREEQSLGLEPVRAAAEKEEHYLSYLNDVRPIEEAVAIARNYHGRVPMAVASGGTREVIGTVLRHLGIEGLFVAVITAEDVSRQKPAPDIFLKAAEKMGVPAGECIGFEDSELGMQAITAAGMEAVHIDSLRNFVS